MNVCDDRDPHAQDPQGGRVDGAASGCRRLHFSHPLAYTTRLRRHAWRQIEIRRIASVLGPARRERFGVRLSENQTQNAEVGDGSSPRALIEGTSQVRDPIGPI